MPLYDFTCESCKKSFESLVSTSSPTEITCPDCGSKEVKRELSRFKVAGQGDLRESTQHGCHGCHVGHKHGKN